MKQKSFTLIELLVVIAIIGILSGFVYVQVNNAMNTGKDAKRKSDIQLLASGINNYLMESVSLPVSSECTISGTCSSEINEAFESQLGSLPSDPDSGQYYTYESDGTDCAISSVLSTGETYQYTCSDDTIATVNTPVDGVCGSSDGQNLSSIPSTNLCSTGTASSVSGSGPWTWTCSGLYEGDDASCSSSVIYASTCVSRDGITCTETSDGNYAIYKFTISGTQTSSTGTAVETYWDVPAGVTTLDYLVVGGGGAGGGGCAGGGGGAGGVMKGTMTSLPGRTIWFYVGTGASGITSACGYDNNTIRSGGGSGFGGVSAGGYTVNLEIVPDIPTVSSTRLVLSGGGGGSGSNQPGGYGGSGGGGNGGYQTLGGSGYNSSGSFGGGNNGGDGYYNTGGGGGGCNHSGYYGGTSGATGNGGAGYDASVFFGHSAGTDLIAGGGGGGGNGYNGYGLGASGGGNGGLLNAGGSDATSMGSGGGGVGECSSGTYTSGSGAAGFVAVRFLKP